MENESESFSRKKGFPIGFSFIGFCVLTTFYGLNGESIGFEKDFNFTFFVRRLIFYLHFKAERENKKVEIREKDVHKKGQLRIIDSASFSFFSFSWIT